MRISQSNEIKLGTGLTRDESNTSAKSEADWLHSCQSQTEQANRQVA